MIIPWGTPIHAGGPAWRKDASNTAAEQLLQVGVHHDGMHFFPLDDGGKGRRQNRRGLLVLNHEYIDRTIHYTDGDAVMTQEKVTRRSPATASRSSRWSSSTASGSTSRLAATTGGSRRSRRR